MANEDIKRMAVDHNVRLWEVADDLGITDTTFSKKLRKELREDDKARIASIIDRLAAERKE